MFYCCLRCMTSHICFLVNITNNKINTSCFLDKRWKMHHKHTQSIIWLFLLQLTPHSMCSITHRAAYTYQLTHHMDIWRVCKETELMAEMREEGKTEMELMVWHFYTQKPKTVWFNSQQHVLLVLLENGADMLKDVRVKQVYTTVDDVTDKCARLFHIMQDLHKKQETWLVMVMSEFYGRHEELEYVPHLFLRFQQCSHNS